MLLITCPWCGPREEVEFRYGGEAGVAAPGPTDDLDGPELAAFLFFRSNPKGTFNERWHHSHGCRRWFAVRRNTINHRFESESEPIGRYRP